jgi:hypothetical protein
MPDYKDIEKAREEAAAQAYKTLQYEVRKMQGLLWQTLVERINQLDTKDGKITYGVRNLSRVQLIFEAFAEFGKRLLPTMLRSVFYRVDQILDLNRRYFEEVVPGKTTNDMATLAREATLLRWGYRVDTKELLPGSYFEKLFSTQGVAQGVAAKVNQAIAAKMPLAEFQKAFRADFVGSTGNGMLERHWKTNSYDLFQRIDRAANLEYAEQLKLNYAIYSGTLKDTSRPFCVARVNKVFNRDQIEDWRKLNFSGKPTVGYDPAADCGGHGCRHHLSFISDEIAQRLKARWWNDETFVEK